MTAVAASRRLLQSIPFTKFGGFNVAAYRFCIDPSVVKFSSRSWITNSRTSRFDCRQISQLVKSDWNRPFLVDTLALVSRFEAQGIPTKQAKAITAAMTKVLNDSSEHVFRSFVSKEELEEVEAIREYNYFKIKSELKMAQGHHISSLQLENEKLIGEIEKIRTELRFVFEKLQGDIEKSCSERRFAIDKVIDSLRLGLHVEKAGMRDELANQSAVISNLNNKIDKAIRGFGDQLEDAKTEVINYFIFVSISAVGVAIFCFFV